MPTNTTYNPTNTNDFDKTKLNFSGKSITFDCRPGETAYSDLQLTDDSLMTGGILLVKGGEINDQVYLQIAHPTLGVVNEFVSGFRIIEDQIKQFELQLNYPAKIFAGLSIRCKYVACSTMESTRSIALNLILHKVLE